MSEIPTVVIWGTKNCKLCQQARDKILTIFCISCTDKDITPILTGDADRSDRSVMGVSVALHMNNGDYPIVQVNQKFYTYPEALNEIRKLLNIKNL